MPSLATAAELAGRVASTPADAPSSDQIYIQALALMESGVVASVGEGTTYLQLLAAERRGDPLPAETKKYISAAREIESRVNEIHRMRQAALARQDRIALLKSRRASLLQRLANEQAESATFYDEKKSLSLCAAEYIERWPFSGAPLDARAECLGRTLLALRFKKFLDEHVIPELMRRLAEIDSELTQLLSAEPSAA